MKTVITYGTFDLLHIGHIRILKRLRALGDRLVVGVSTDAFNAVKGKHSFFEYDVRKEMLLSCRYVDAVFAEECWEQKKGDILRLNAQLFGIGSDWKGKFDFLKEYCEVVYLERTLNISTTQIRSELNSLVLSSEGKYSYS